MNVPPLRSICIATMNDSTNRPGATGGSPRAAAAALSARGGSGQVRTRRTGVRGFGVAIEAEKPAAPGNLEEVGSGGHEARSAESAAREAHADARHADAGEGSAGVLRDPEGALQGLGERAVAQGLRKEVKRAR